MQRFRNVLRVGASLAFAAFVVAVQPAPAAARQGEDEPIRYKGVFEPVNYPADLNLVDVAFVSADVGWVVGGVFGRGGGVILHTKDGGDSWTIQLGDPESADEPFRDLRFVDAQHGFAVQPSGSGDHRLLRTSDGETWEVSGTVPQHRGDYTFISPEVGFASADGQILRTDDAGRTWRAVHTCRLSVEVDGLMRDAECRIGNFHFPSPLVGYGIGSSDQAGGLFVAKTEDGGATWSAWQTLPAESGKEGHVFFTSDEQGVACLIGGKLFRTADGGRTWSQIAGPSCDGKPWVEFADDQVGWTVAYSTLNYTTNGGGRWVSREIAFPTHVTAFSLPRRDRGYVVGDHGMVYRYRVVPETAAVSPKAIPAPVMGPPVQESAAGGDANAR